MKPIVIRFQPAPGLSLAMVPVLAILIALGIWQVKRLHWKTALLAQIERGTHLPPEPLAKLLEQQKTGDMIAWRQASVHGHFIARPPQPLYSLRQGKQALRLLAPFVSDSGIAITVDLGFVPFLPDKTWALPVDSATPLSLHGILKPVRKPGPFAIANTPGGLWFSPDTKDLLAPIKTARPLTAFLLDLQGPRNGPDWPEPAPAHADIPNNHLDYALTWFGLALAAIGVYLGWHVRNGRLGLARKR